ncbi:hypothetical protein IMX26_17275 [Clostridium sp. 'deep sea']|uniref:hypothetical protein n=1 Tax=Clostridium sp. 'deep sea' TaxID=2779445 RepID=UPI00189668CA|nr:hypothetical protein [Clostridium sp. 'deep sea']QOR35184.1 hypothetical protein IMX26_17275 [Clostridium sp. 'deep sea']
MTITITKEFIQRESKKHLKSIFELPELDEIIIKGVVIASLDDELVINKAIDECFHDIYSDVDVELLIKLNQDEYNSNSTIYADCLRRLGFENDILGMLHYSTIERGEVIRICKTNGMRFDLTIKAICMEGIFKLPHDEITDNLRRLDEFWFIAIQALGKLMRKDYLIASHLTHNLIQEGLVLQMEMRDKEKDTNFHRFGYKEELDYLSIIKSEEIAFAKTLDEIYNHIARLLYSAVKSYDRLYYSLNNSYKSRIENYSEIWSCYCKDINI